MAENTYFKLDVDDLPRGTAKSWTRELATAENGKITVVELSGTTYYVVFYKSSTAELFEAKLVRQEVSFEKSSSPPEEYARSSSSSGSRGTSSSGSGRDGGGFWDDLFEGIGDFFGDLFD